MNIATSDTPYRRNIFIGFLLALIFLLTLTLLEDHPEAPSGLILIPNLVFIAVIMYIFLPDLSRVSLLQNSVLIENRKGSLELGFNEIQEISARITMVRKRYPYQPYAIYDIIFKQKTELGNRVSFKIKMTHENEKILDELERLIILAR